MTEPGVRAGSSGPREDSDVEDLGPEAEVSASESPDQD